MRLDAVVLAAAVSVQPALVIHALTPVLMASRRARACASASLVMNRSDSRCCSSNTRSRPAIRPDAMSAALLRNQNWTAGNAIAFVVNPDHPLRLSVSFIDRNGVVYTAWKDLDGGVWQPVRIPFDKIQPNPYFQPPGARTGAPIDVSEVRMVAFAPQDKTAGRLKISSLYLSP
jgi:hypothetical protein